MYLCFQEDIHIRASIYDTSFDAKSPTCGELNGLGAGESVVSVQCQKFLPRMRVRVHALNNQPVRLAFAEIELFAQGGYTSEGMTSFIK